MQDNDLEKMADALKNAGKDKNVSSRAVSEAIGKLSDAQKSEMDALLQDPDRLKRLLETPIAKKLLSDLEKR